MGGRDAGRERGYVESNEGKGANVCSDHERMAWEARREHIRSRSRRRRRRRRSIDNVWAADQPPRTSWRCSGARRAAAAAASASHGETGALTGACACVGRRSRREWVTTGFPVESRQRGSLTAAAMAARLYSRSKAGGKAERVALFSSHESKF